MSNKHFFPWGPVSRIRAMAKRFLKDEAGAEVIQFVMVLPLLFALLWTSFEIWQIMSLRAALRTTTAQAARFVTAFAGLPAELRNRPGYRYPDICAEVQALVVKSLDGYRGILGDRLGDPQITWIWVNDPLPQSDPRADWNGNIREFSDCGTFLSGLACDDAGEASVRQFAVRVHVDVPWLRVLFSMGGTSATPLTLSLEDTSVGAITCMPECNDDCVTAHIQGQPRCSGSRCSVDICWDLQLAGCDFVPKIEVWQGTQGPLLVETNPLVITCREVHDVHADPGVISFATVKAVGRQGVLCQYDVEIDRR